MNQTERDYRVGMLNALLINPHADRRRTKKDSAESQQTRERVKKFHAELIENDPLFYGKLGYWYLNNGSIRDHKEAFVGNMFLSPVPEHREAAYCVVTGINLLAPYQVPRVIDYVEVEQKKNMPRIMKNAIHGFFDTLQGNPDRFDGAVLQGKDALLFAARRVRTRLNDRAKGILFEGRYPEGSVFEKLKELSQGDHSPQEIAKIFVDYKVPLKQMAPHLKSITPTVLAALINNMSPQELVNNMGFLKERGAMDNPTLRQLINQKIDAVGKDTKRAQALKTRTAVDTGRIRDEEIEQKLEEAGSKLIKAKGTIRHDTLLAVDKSSSMQPAIALAKKIGPLIAQAIAPGAKMYVYAFDGAPHDLGNPGTDLASWEKAFRFINANGWTACGAPLAALSRKNISVSNIVIISDGGDNEKPRFIDAYREYKGKFGIAPSVTFLATPTNERAHENFASILKSDPDMDSRMIVCQGDQYSLPDIITLITRPSMFDLVCEIMEIELPRRAA